MRIFTLLLLTVCWLCATITFFTFYPILPAVLSSGLTAIIGGALREGVLSCESE